ncbi:RDM16 [Symbiodinium natans]|uniref:RDM16 protein n=1 Tax=Symbiodinium natans TaxID=878477 RepID=A0A812RGI2_9DINO|nr:RDM16 [Symbiodinium natans]
MTEEAENGDTEEVEKPTDVEAAEVVEDLDAVKEDPKPKRQRRNRWGQEPEAPPMPSADDLALAPLMSMDTAALGLLPVQPGMGATPGIGAGASLDLSAAAQAAREALEKAKRAAMFQRQIQEQMSKIKGQGLGGGFMGAEAPKARKLILDEFGRELDEDGQVVPMKPQVVSTLKVNINREKEARLKKILGLKKDGAGGESSYFDSTLKVKERFERQKRRNFRFIEEGELVKKEQKMIKKVQEKALGLDKKDDKKKKEEEQKKQEKKKEEEEEKEQPVKKIEPKVMRREPIPDVEWWDAPFLKEDQYGQRRAYTEVNVEKITPYVEHPIPIKITTEKEAPEAAMMHLTPKERKKLRRLKRQERTQEIRDKIKMGILQAPPPKVKMANLMRVLGDEAVADPSTVERKVRQQVEQRRKEHEQRNEARRLPAEERKQKKKQKWMAEGEPVVQVLVFKIKDLANKKHLFKIDMNAQQFHLTGCCIACPGVANIVVVEGGPRAIKRYKKLMIRRIKWTEEQADEDDDDEDQDEVTAPKLQDHCVLVWEGVVKQRSFKNWKVSHVRNEPEARKLLNDRQADHYWDMLARYRDPRMDI